MACQCDLFLVCCIATKNRPIIFDYNGLENIPRNIRENHGHIARCTPKSLITGSDGNVVILRCAYFACGCLRPERSHGRWRVISWWRFISSSTKPEFKKFFVCQPWYCSKFRFLTKFLDLSKITIFHFFLFFNTTESFDFSPKFKFLVFDQYIDFSPEFQLVTICCCSKISISDSTKKIRKLF